MRVRGVGELCSRRFRLPERLTPSLILQSRGYFQPAGNKLYGRGMGVLRWRSLDIISTHHRHPDVYPFPVIPSNEEKWRGDVSGPGP